MDEHQFGNVTSVSQQDSRVFSQSSHNWRLFSKEPQILKRFHQKVRIPLKAIRNWDLLYLTADMKEA